MIKKIILWIILLLPYVGAFFVWHHYEKKEKELKESTFVVIDKQELQLTVFDYLGNAVAKYPIAVGKNYGTKQKKGDNRTPEGVFHISDIQEADSWTHDFHDGQGEISGAYGPFFIRLSTPGFSGIGIHGTHAPTSIGTRATEGCIRLKNEDVSKLRDQVKIGNVVIILPSYNDAIVSLDSISIE